MHHALRSLLKAPGFTLLAVLTLALGIGMNTAMFSMLNGLLLRPLEYPEADRLFRLDRNTPQQPRENHSALDFEEIAAASREIAELTAYRYWGFTLSDGDQPPDVPTALRVSTNFFHVLGRLPAEGRTFAASEDTPGKNNVLIISHRYWMSRFRGAPDVVGRSIRLDGTPVEIIGVLPPDEDAPRVLGPVDIFRPLGLEQNERNRHDHSLNVIGRYRNGVSPEHAAAQFAALGRRLDENARDENARVTLGVRSLQSTT